MGVKIFWTAGLSFILGVFFRSLITVPESFLIFVACVAIALSIFVAFDRRVPRSALLLVIGLISCALGAWRMGSAALVSDPHLDSRIGSNVIAEGFVFAEPDLREGSVRVPVRITSIASSSAQLHASVLVIAHGTAHVAYGDHVRVSGTLELPKPFDTNNGRQFNYPGYLAKDGIGYEMSFASIKKTDGWTGDMFTAVAIHIKQLFVQGLEMSLPEPESGLAAGITVGDKRGLGKDLSKEFQAVSLVHVIVLSGYNITVVISALERMTAWTPRLVRFAGGGLVALTFVLMTGGAAASVRAAIMALIGMTAQYQGRIYRADRALLFAAVGMAAWNPFLVVFDPGFQLSILATLGLIYLSPILTQWFQRLPKIAGIQDIAISSTSAQLAVLPLLLYQTGQLSLVALPANLFALAVVPQAMFFSSIAALAGLMLGPIAPVLAFPAYILLRYIISVAHLFANVPFSTLPIPPFNPWLLVPMYATLFLFALHLGNSVAEKNKTP